MLALFRGFGGGFIRAPMRAVPAKPKARLDPFTDDLGAAWTRAGLLKHHRVTSAKTLGLVASNFV